MLRGNRACLTCYENAITSETAPVEFRLYSVFLRLRCTAGRTSHVTECFDQSVYPVEQSRPCNVDCGEWTVQLIGQWSDCQLLTDTPSSAAQLERVGTVHAGTAYCGIGRRYHAVVCTNKDGRQNVSATVCGATGPE